MFVFDRWDQANDVDEILLLHANTSKIPSRGGLNFTLFGFFAFGGGLLFVLVQLIEFEFFSGGNLVLNSLLVIRASTIGTGASFVGIFETIEAKLTDLKEQVRLWNKGTGRGGCEEVDLPDNHKDMA